MFAACWIGLYFLQSNRTWAWVDGSSGTYFDWANGEPNNAKKNEFCVYSWNQRSQQWNDHDCGTTVPFICEGSTGG